MQLNRRSTSGNSWRTCRVPKSRHQTNCTPKPLLTPAVRCRRQPCFCRSRSVIGRSHPVSDNSDCEERPTPSTRFVHRQRLQLCIGEAASMPAEGAAHLNYTPPSPQARYIFLDNLFDCFIVDFDMQLFLLLLLLLVVGPTRISTVLLLFKAFGKIRQPSANPKPCSFAAEPIDSPRAVVVRRRRLNGNESLSWR